MAATRLSLWLPLASAVPASHYNLWMVFRMTHDEHSPLYKYQHRHPATQHAMRWLLPNPNLAGAAEAVASRIWDAAEELVAFLNDGPELTAGLRKLREAKDCLVIQSLADLEEAAHAPKS